jgi:hypothetical protein
MEQQSLSTAEPTAAEVLVRDPLSAVTRKERLYLLAVSMIGIAMVRTGLVPSKIATFGIELDKPNRSALLFLLALVTIYFLGAFSIYAASDYMTRREVLRAASKREALDDRFRMVALVLNATEGWIRKLYSEDPGELQQTAVDVIEGRKGIHELQEEIGDPEPMAFRFRINEETIGESYGYRRSLWVGLTRVLFEFLLPIVVGLYAIYSLLARSLS